MSVSGQAVTPAGSLVRQAFDVVGALQEAGNLADLDAAVEPTLRALGFRDFFTAQCFRSDRTPEPRILHGYADPAWASHYEESGYARVSAITRRVLTAENAFTWNSVIFEGIDETTRKILNEARAFGFNDGLYTPVRGSRGSYCTVSLCAGDADLSDPLLRIMAEVISGYYGAAGRRILNTKVKEDIRLTRRQRECLSWVREGKSSAAIAGIMGLSSSTVDEHISEACRKLRVRTRVQAAIEAGMLGLIDL